MERQRHQRRTRVELLITVLVVVVGIALVAVGPTFLDVDLGDIRAGAVDLLVVAASAGLISMAIIQIAKELLGYRGLHNRKALEEWLESDLPGVVRDVYLIKDAKQGRRSPGSQSADAEGALSMAERLSNLLSQQDIDTLMEWPPLSLLMNAMEVKNQDMFLAQPIELICAQLGTAADLTASFPIENSPTLLVLTSPTYFGGAVDFLEAAQNIDQKDEEISQRAMIETPVEAGRPHKMEDRYFALRTQTSHHLQRSLDEVQLTTGATWRRKVRLSAVLLSASLVIGIASASGLQTQIIALVAAGLVGGYLSWVFRDITAIVERWRIS